MEIAWHQNILYKDPKLIMEAEVDMEYNIQLVGFMTPTEW